MTLQALIWTIPGSCVRFYLNHMTQEGEKKKKRTEDVPVCLFLEENQTFRSGLLRRAAENERRKYILSPKKGRKGRREFLSCLHLLLSICPARKKKKKAIVLANFSFHIGKRDLTYSVQLLLAERHYHRPCQGCWLTG